MEPNAFIAEFYRRMSIRHAAVEPRPNWLEMKGSPLVKAAMHQYASILPRDTNAAILDIGFGQGWFMAACVNLGYTNIHGAEFNATARDHILHWSPSIRALHNIDTTIAEFLATMPGSFDFIHLSHVIEHIPKYSLLHFVDALFLALKSDGVLLLRTPNMEGPCSNSSMYVTLGHEYGFSGSNLASLLDVCNFDDIRLHRFSTPDPSLKQIAGQLLRLPIIKWNSFKHRLFGVNHGGEFGAELIVSARRGNLPPLFDNAYR